MSTEPEPSEKKHWVHFRRCLVFFAHLITVGILITIPAPAGSPVLLVLNGVAGFLAVILIPGTTLRVLLHDTIPSIPGLSVLLGTLVAILIVHIQFLLSLFLGLTVPLRVFLGVSIPILGGFMLAVSPRTASIATVSYWKRQWSSVERYLFYAFCLALVTRVLFMLLGSSSIAPDACVYSDYARSIQQGVFHSNLLNDEGVFQRSPTTHEIWHQGIGYVFAISMMLLPTTVGAPMLLTLILGSMVVFPTFEIAAHFLSREAGLFAACIVAISPSMVYFSSVGYGPSISTLAILAYAVALILRAEPGSRGTFFLLGVLVAMIEFVWFANYYVTCMILAVGPILMSPQQRLQGAISAVSVSCVLLARMVIHEVPLFAFVWLVVLALFILPRRLGLSLPDWYRSWPLFLSLVVSQEFLHIPSQISNLQSEGAVPGFGASTLLVSLTSPISPEYMLRFLCFLAFHSLLPVLALFVIVITSRTLRYTVRSLSVVTLLGLLGTLPVIHVFEPLILEQLFTSGRFFLFPVLMITIVASGGFVSLAYDKGFPTQLRSSRPDRKRLRTVLILLFVNLTPVYLVAYTGLSYVNPVQRYGWYGLDTIVDDIPPGARVIADRAREFAWVHNRTSVVMVIQEVPTDVTTVLLLIARLSIQFEADYLLIDLYTVDRIYVLRPLLTAQYAEGEEIEFGVVTTSGPGNQSVVYRVSGTVYRENSADPTRRSVRLFEMARTPL
ncbi:MAG: hypothetical protein HXY34_04850 [Candidatus Thorarchaeota archaeon]|nr:hypothetical protein [Candidatus Thorarchaeota archaeon]